MKKVTILAMKNTMASAIVGPMDVFYQAGVLWNYFKGQKIDLVPYIKKHRVQFVLKPNTEFNDSSIVLGCQVSEKEWQHALEKALSLKAKENQFYVVQELGAMSTYDVPLIEGNEFKGFFPRHVQFNLWAHDGEFKGCDINMSLSKITNVSFGGAIVPVFFVEK